MGRCLRGQVAGCKGLVTLQYLPYLHTVFIKFSNRLLAVIGGWGRIRSAKSISMAHRSFWPLWPQISRRRQTTVCPIKLHGAKHANTSALRISGFRDRAGPPESHRGPAYGGYHATAMCKCSSKISSPKPTSASASCTLPLGRVRSV